MFLHISKDEQRKRLRLDDPTKTWKFRLADLEDRVLFDDYLAAYEEALGETSTEWAPWHVVPADRKWARDVVVATLLVETLRKLNPQYAAARRPRRDHGRVALAPSARPESRLALRRLQSVAVRRPRRANTCPVLTLPCVLARPFARRNIKGFRDGTLESPRAGDLHRVPRRRGCARHRSEPGIGRAIAVALAGLGADVGLVQRGDAAETAAEIAALGRRAHVVQVDLGDSGAAEAPLRVAARSAASTCVSATRASSAASRPSTPRSRSSSGSWPSTSSARSRHPGRGARSSRPDPPDASSTSPP